MIRVTRVIRLAPIIVWSLAFSACLTLKPKPPQPTPEPLPPASYTLAAIVHDQHGAPVPDSRITIEPGAVTFAATNADGYSAAQVGPGTYRLTADTDCCGVARSEPFTLTGNRDVSLTVTRPEPPPQPKPWETVTRDQLRAWRGSISTTIAPMPCGPRPNQPNNVMFTALFDSSCWAAADRARALAAFTAKQWTHWPIGPIESKGYHGQAPDMDWTGNPDGFADRLEELWRAGRIPVLFLLPDTGYCADGQSVDWDCVEAKLTPAYSSPRFQALAKIVVLAWEPEYRADDYVRGVEWMARVFPAARRGLHFPSGHSAPCRGSELVEGGGPIKDEGACWALVASRIHFYLQQETWVFGGEDTAAGRTPLQQFLYNLWDTSHRFADGSWPAVGADGQPIDVIAFEYASYHVTHHPELARQADEWGDAAISIAPYADPLNGRWIDPARYLTGYGDGGTLDPSIRLPRRSFSLIPSNSEPRRFTFTLTPEIR